MTLTGIIIPDKNDKNFVGYMLEYPGVMAQGSSPEETQEKLEYAWKLFLDFQANQNQTIKFDTINPNALQ